MPTLQYTLMPPRSRPDRVLLFPPYRIDGIIYQCRKLALVSKVHPTCVFVCVSVSGVPGISLLYDWVPCHCGVVGSHPRIKFEYDLIYLLSNIDSTFKLYVIIGFKSNL